MKTCKNGVFVNGFGLLQSSSKQIALLFCTLVLPILFGGTELIAQSTTGFSDTNIKLNTWVLSVFGVVFFISVIYVLRSALLVLHENGKNVEFKFPMFRNMANNNNRTVTVIILLIVMCGIVWAVNYTG